jgi:hypothetical protein
VTNITISKSVREQLEEMVRDHLLSVQHSSQALLQALDIAEQEILERLAELKM